MPMMAIIHSGLVKIRPITAKKRSIILFSTLYIFISQLILCDLQSAQHHFKCFRIITPSLTSSICSKALNSLCRTWMRIRTHYATIHRQRLHLDINAFSPDFHPCVRLESVHGRVQGPFGTRRHLHIPELLNGLHLRPALEQTYRFLTRHRRLQVVVVRIRSMMRDDNVWLTLPDGRLDVLHQLQVRHRVHLDVRECAFKLSTDAQEIRCRIQVIIQLLVLGDGKP